MTYLRLPGMVMITMITRNPHNKTELFLNNLGYIQLIQPSVEISFLRTVLNFFSFHSIENLFFVIIQPRIYIFTNLEEMRVRVLFLGQLVIKENKKLIKYLRN